MAEKNAKSGGWLPNLVGGVSIWRLAPDLNAPRFFDGGLLAPDTEGSDSLPTRVRWNLVGLMPLSAARGRYGDAVGRALEDFRVRLQAVSTALGTPESGYQQYAAALTVPSWEADGGDNYFFDPQRQRIKVINWGASPRSIAPNQELFFGAQDFEQLFAGTSPASTPPGDSSETTPPLAEGAVGVAEETLTEELPAAPPEGGPPALVEDGAPPGPSSEGGDEVAAVEVKDTAPSGDQARALHRSPWVWVLAAAVLAFLLLMLLLPATCARQGDAPRVDPAVDAAGGSGGGGGGGSGGSGAGGAGGSGGSGGGGRAGAGGAGGAGGEAAGGAGGSGGGGAAGGGGSGGAGGAGGAGGEGSGGAGAGGAGGGAGAPGAGGGGGANGSGAGGAAAGGGGAGGSGAAGEGGGAGGTGAGGGPGSPSGGAAGSAAGGAAAGGGGSGSTGGGAAGAGDSPPTSAGGSPAPPDTRPNAITFLPEKTFRHSGARAWRVVAGADALHPRSEASGKGDTFKLFLNPDQSFDAVQVEWQDASGNWHPSENDDSQR
ncbi:MAG: hypothetical protein HYV63_14385 [Candidatus Schekmanbacteria bacterium]|nr:hypothetical protein [Candidatus Schekmanbacteria bacterium]